MNKETRKVMIHRRERMKNLQNWSPKLRKKVSPYVFKNLGTFQMPYAVCRDKRAFAQWLYETAGYGYFYIYIWRPGYFKKKERLRPYNIAKVEIKETERGNYAVKFHDMSRIKRFKWWGTV